MQRTAQARVARGSASQATSRVVTVDSLDRAADDGRNSGDARGMRCLHGDMVVEVIDGRTLDDITAAEIADVANAAQAVDAPQNESESGERVRLSLKHGWDDRGTEHVVLARVDRSLAAFAAVDLTSWDNRHMAFVELYVRPEHRPSSVGEHVVDQAYAVMKANDRTLLVADAWADSDLERFWLDHGLEMASKGAQRRLLPPSLDWAQLDDLHAEATAASGAYEVFEASRPVPDDLIDGMVQLQLAMNDAPLNDLALEDHTWNAARYRDFESAITHRHMTSYRLVARHRETGDMAGFTAVVVEHERPHLGFQGDTAVVREHRGHRLGLRLKIEMLQLLRQREPQIRQIDTWNALSNAHMIAVNEAIGCFAVGYGGQLQRDLTKSGS
jgi:GNAT superfamily N-acetyltransferase